MKGNILFWIIFIVVVGLFFALDLGVFHRKVHRVSVREAIKWCIIWVIVALIFMIVVWIDYYRESTLIAKTKVLEFLTGYLIEYALSVDNIFVFILIFSYFNVDEKYHHKILFWGILGAILMRALFIFAGVTLIKKFHWVVYIFGAFLVYSGSKMLWENIKKVAPKIDPEHNPVVKFTRRFIRITDTDQNGRFFLRVNNKLYATSLFLVLLIIESTDLIFAVDSIPAVLAITSDPFIVLTSNILAILGLRSLYFALSGIMKLFKYLKSGLSLVLIFVGMKMIFAEALEKLDIPIYVSLIVIVTILGASVVASLVTNKRG